MNLTPMDLHNFTIPVQYYGMNATDFFGGKITWPDCRLWAMTQHIEFNYWGIYHIIMPLILVLTFFIFWLFLKEWAESKEKRDYLPIMPYILVLVTLLLFMFWYNGIKAEYLAMVVP